MYRKLLSATLVFAVVVSSNIMFMQPAEAKGLCKRGESYVKQKVVTKDTSWRRTSDKSGAGLKFTTSVSSYRCNTMATSRIVITDAKISWAKLNTQTGDWNCKLLSRVSNFKLNPDRIAGKDAEARKSTCKPYGTYNIDVRPRAYNANNKTEDRCLGGTFTLIRTGTDANITLRKACV